MTKHAFQYWWSHQKSFSESDVLWFLFCPCSSFPIVLFLDDIFLNVTVGYAFPFHPITITSKKLSLLLTYFYDEFPKPWLVWSIGSLFCTDSLWVVYWLVLISIVLFCLSSWHFTLLVLTVEFYFPRFFFQ